jgi:hypothetical protein
LELCFLIANQKSTTIIQAISKGVRDVYCKRGFQVTCILMDGQFEGIRGDLAGLNITLNTVANDDACP